MADETTAGVYLRVSTEDQSIENQREALEEWVRSRGWTPHYFEDNGVSGSARDRPGYQALMEAARQGKIEAVVVWKLDRLGRSMTQLLLDVERLQGWGVDLVTYEGQIDTTTPAGKIQLAVFSALAEIERDVISERTKAAYRRKQANGEMDWGRPEKDVPTHLVRAVAAGELTQADAARKAGVSRTTIRRRVRALNGR